MNENEQLWITGIRPAQRIRKPRAPDELWNLFTETFGDARTKTERGRRNAAIKELREANATVEEVRITIDYCRRFSGFTEKALCAHLSRALHEQGSISNVRQLFQRAKGEGG